MGELEDVIHRLVRYSLILVDVFIQVGESIQEGETYHMEHYPILDK